MTYWRELAHAPAPGTLLCESSEVPDGGGREVSFGEGPEPFRVLLLRLGSRVFAYHNCCPHFSQPLNYEPQVFHVYDREYLMCAHHTALFRITDGYCFDGPCAGANLTPIPIISDGGVIRVA
jgi:nitrite reductase/ring-hydroxylating ferredoxin subunit